MTDAPDAPDSPRSSLDGEDIVIEDEDPLVGGQAQKATKLNVLDGIALVIGLQIGSGIFSAPSQVSSNVISPGEGILVWIFSGLLAWTGAASFIELGLAIPRNGGIQEYLQYCYGDFAGFLFTWTWTIIVKPAANAVIATVLGDYLSSTMSPSNQPITIISKVLGTLFIVIITFINCLGARTSRNVATGFLVFKLILAFSIISIGISFCFKSGEGVPSSGLGWFGVTNPSTVSIWARLGNIVTAMLGALFCYGGWESIGFVLGDMDQPNRNLPRVLNIAMSITIVVFALIVTAFYLCIPFEDIRNTTTLAVEYGNRVLGSSGKLLYAVCVAISALGAVNVNIFASARLCVVASERQYFPAIFSNLHVREGSSEMLYYREKLQRYPWWISYAVSKFALLTSELRLKQSVPVYAYMLNAILAIIYVVIGTFEGLLVFVGLSEYFFFFLCIVGVFIIRREKSRTGDIKISTFKTWTVNPIVFLCVSGFLIIRGILANLIQAASLASVIILGWVFFKRIAPLAVLPPSTP